MSKFVILSSCNFSPSDGICKMQQLLVVQEHYWTKGYIMGVLPPMENLLCTSLGNIGFSYT